MYNKKRTGARYRRYGVSHRRRTGNSYKLVALILCISIGCGYAAAKYVVEPVVNYVPRTVEIGAQNKTGEADINTEETAKVVEDTVDIKESKGISGYAIQFGCFSNRKAAEAVKSNIDVNDLQIIENNDMYKIVGKIYSDKNEAKQALEAVPDDIDAFVTAVYK